MPFCFEFDSANQILRIPFEGAVTDEEITEFYRLASVHAMRILPRAGIIDFSAVTDFRVAPETMRRLAESPPAFDEAKVPRFVVAPSPITFGMARVFELYGDRTRPNFYVVRSAQEVWARLGIQEPQFEPLPPLPD